MAKVYPIPPTRATAQPAGCRRLTKPRGAGLRIIYHRARPTKCLTSRLKDEMHELTYRLMIRAFRLIFVLLGLRVEVRGAQNLPTSGPAIVACNHLGYLDFAFVGLAGHHRHRLVRFMAKQSTFDNPISGPLMRSMRHIPVDRSCGAPAARQARDALRRGEMVGIFPEATISPSWTLKPFMRGAATLAAHEQVPLIPVAVWGGQRILTVGGRWSLRRGKAISIIIGEPICPAETTVDPSDTADGRISRKDEVTSVNAMLRQRMKSLLDQAQRDYPDSPCDGADRWWMPQHLGGTAPTPKESAGLELTGMLR